MGSIIASNFFFLFPWIERTIYFLFLCFIKRQHEGVLKCVNKRLTFYVITNHHRKMIYRFIATNANFIFSTLLFIIYVWIIRSGNVIGNFCDQMNVKFWQRRDKLSWLKMGNKEKMMVVLLLHTAHWAPLDFIWLPCAIN